MKVLQDKKKFSYLLLTGVVIITLSSSVAQAEIYVPNDIIRQAGEIEDIIIKPDVTEIAYLPESSKETSEILNDEIGDASDVDLITMDQDTEEAMEAANTEAIFEELLEDDVSVVESKLSTETVLFIKNIPAEGLKTKTNETIIKNPVVIKRANIKNPFPEEVVAQGGDNEVVEIEKSEDVEPMRKAVGLKLSIKEADNSLFENLSLAREAMVSGQLEVSIAYYKKVLNREFDNPKALFGLATAYQKNKQLEQARDIYIELIKKNPRNNAAVNNFLLIVAEESPDTAIENLKELEKNNRNFAPLPAQIAMLYMKEKNYEQAAISLGKAISIDPENTSYRYNFAVVMEHMNQQEVAAKLYEQLLLLSSRGKKLQISEKILTDRLYQIRNMQAMR